MHCLKCNGCCLTTVVTRTFVVIPFQFMSSQVVPNSVQCCACCPCSCCERDICLISPRPEKWETKVTFWKGRHQLHSYNSNGEMAICVLLRCFVLACCQCCNKCVPHDEKIAFAKRATAPITVLDAKPAAATKDVAMLR